jgi:ABC-type branched-subunit amino acid transport system permease subunit
MSRVGLTRKAVRRFLPAYLAASAAATIATLLVQSAQVLAAGTGFDTFHDILPTTMIYAIYSLCFTLVLGLVGWAILRALHRVGVLAFGIVGAFLGLLTAGMWISDGFRWPNPFLFAFPAAGVAAALTFRSLYYRPPAVSAGRDAVA